MRILTFLLALLLAACGGGDAPDEPLDERASIPQCERPSAPAPACAQLRR
jgi:hypothetical protein